ncbi:hypothetical protein F5884DRAFT_393352 [Xylogone sp. PMI_703]|nr:hypothetical protein F5884DRAFT_393352 [Xylogone sp. PMI_703]
MNRSIPDVDFNVPGLNSPTPLSSGRPRSLLHNQAEIAQDGSTDSSSIYLPCTTMLRRRLSPPATQPPSPQQSHIRLNQIAFMAACFANLGMLGMNPKIASLEDCESPFFRPELSQRDSQTLTRTLESDFRHLKSDLRPRVVQLTKSHHPYIDILPFPELRERIITLLHLSPSFFDEEEFCMDLCLKDGLICWGSQSQSGSGMPWDARSWEATPWFMKKWWMLLGGRKSSIYSQTQWWREMRGLRCEILW